MRAHTVKDLERDLDLLSRYECGLNQYQLAEEEGQSQAHISHRLKRARCYKAELDKRDKADTSDTDDIPYVPLTEEPEREKGDWYDLRTDVMTVSSGKVRIGDHNGRSLRVRPVRGGSVRVDEEPKSDKAAVNDSDKARGVVYVQNAG